MTILSYKLLPFVYLGVFVKFLGLIVPVLLAVALLTLLERKVIGYMQFRKGPNLVGPLGVLQPIADGLKLFIKEKVSPSSASPLLFFLAPGRFLSFCRCSLEGCPGLLFRGQLFSIFAFCFRGV